MSAKTVFAAIKYAEKCFERLSDVVCDEDQDDISAALGKLAFAKEELEKLILAGPQKEESKP